MRKVKFILTISLCLLYIVQINAYNFEMDGIYYNYIPGTKNLEVTYNPDNGYIGKVVIPETVTYSGTTYRVTRIGERAFYPSSLPNANTNLPDNVNNKKNVSLQYPYLTSVVIPKGVKKIGKEAFMGCIELSSVTIPEGVINIGSGAFMNCCALKSIKLPNSLINIEEKAFMGCNFTSIVIPENVINIGEKAFMTCIYLTSVNIPKSLTHIDKYTFYGCNLHSVDIPKSVTSIGERAFGNCRNMVSVSIPGSVTNIGEGAFETCNSLVYVDIPDGVTFIGNYAFDGCSNLVSLTLSNSILDIENYAFRGCYNLKRVEVEWDIPMTVSLYHFQRIDLSQCTLYVPKGSVSYYKSAPVWKDFGKINDNYLFSYRNDIDFKPSGGIDNINVRSSVNWKASTNASWIKISPESSKGSKKLMVSVLPNENDIPRFADVRVSGAGVSNWIVRISQEAFSSDEGIRDFVSQRDEKKSNP
ncbi:MAG: leucine-rich repeat protein [Dysgonamonadaceae bacterium]|nr:leucine-rich repeat protein [Dysgonamonadaceae bacterium]